MRLPVCPRPAAEVSKSDKCGYPSRTKCRLSETNLRTDDGRPSTRPDPGGNRKSSQLCSIRFSVSHRCRWLTSDSAVCGCCRASSWLDFWYFSGEFLMPCRTMLMLDCSTISASRNLPTFVIFGIKKSFIKKTGFS